MTVFILRIVLAVGALLCGVRAMGYWVILQLGGVQPSQRGEIALVAVSSAILFVILALGSAYLWERRSGGRAIFVKALCLIGAYGLPPFALFIATSRGAVLQMPGATALLILFVCFVLLSFVPRGWIMPSRSV